MTGQSAGASPTRHDGDRIPRTPRQMLGQVLGRHHRQLMVSGTNCSACHDYHPTSTDLINAIEAAASPEPPLTVYAVAFSNYEPAEVVAVYASREGAHADAVGREGPYRVIEWEVRRG